MLTIALRFAENFAPESGTIAEHERLISQYGFVWYGKLGTPVSQKVIKAIMSNESPRILLIRSGKAERYWLYVSKIIREKPELIYVPEYYRDQADSFKTWFQVTKIEAAETWILSKCKVHSSDRPLSEASRHSLSPYFIIDAPDLTKTLKKNE